MIRFVCSSCGERLSVPDQHAGRKGVCPTCKGVNRIPLKGFAETAPNAPLVARAVEQPAPATEQSPNERGVIRPAVAPQAPVERPPEVQPSPSPAAQSSSFAPIVDDSPTEYVDISRQWRLPKPVKIALLILAALTVVGGIYFGLLFALHAMVPGS